MTDQKETLYLIMEYLSSLKDAEKGNVDDIETILSLMESQFDVSIAPNTFRQYSIAPLSLAEVIKSGKISLNIQSYETTLLAAKTDPKYDSFVDAVTKKGYFEGTQEGSVEYMERNAKLLSKFKDRVQNTGPSKAELEKQAEELKVKGNTAINSKDYETAIKCYSEALKASDDGPNSHVYYSNRAAAYCHMNRYQDAVDDCLSCLALSPDYVKAYSRLGLAYFFLEKFQEAVDAYERALELEPDNKSTQDSLRQAKSKLKKKTAVSTSSSSASAGGESMPPMGGAGGGGLPNMGGLMNNPAMKKALDQVGGTAGLSNLMKDPQMMAMAQQMMKDPQMMQQAMSMLGGGGGGGGGGMPDMSALAGMMNSMGINQDPPSSSSSSVPSSSSKKKGFKGFEE